jgi:hypothetical protein
VVLAVEAGLTSADGWLRVLEGNGLRLESKPGEQSIQVLDGLGASLPATRAGFEEVIQHLGRMTFKVWTQANVDMVCAVNRDSGLWFWTFSIGYVPDVAEQLATGLLARARSLAEQSAIEGLVVDPDAVTEEYNWEAFFQGTEDYSGVLPDTLLIPKHALGRLDGDVECFAKEELGRSVLLKRIQPLVGDIRSRQPRSEWK